MKARLSEDGTLVVRGETAEESLALTAWHALWARRAAGMQVEVVVRARPQIDIDLWPVNPPDSGPVPLALVEG